MLQIKQYVFQRDLENLAVVQHFTLFRGTNENRMAELETMGNISPPDIFGTEPHRIWHRNYVEAAGELMGYLYSAMEMHRRSNDDPGKLMERYLRLWEMSESDLDRLLLQPEFEYAQEKVDKIVKGSRGERARALVCSLPLYLQLAKGYAQLVGDSSWNPEKIATVATESFDNMCQQVYQLIASTISNEDLHENDCRRVLPVSLYTDDIRATAEALMKYAKAEIDETKLRDLEKLYDKGLCSGKIKDGPEWQSEMFGF